MLQSSKITVIVRAGELESIRIDLALDVLAIHASARIDIPYDTLRAFLAHKVQNVERTVACRDLYFACLV